MKKKISIIVPVYKVEQYLHKCVDSILSQSFTDFELILVNDGSPDNCKNICNDYEKKDSRVIVIHKENGGLSSARNAGLDIATGDYIGFVDSDDYIEKDMYELLYQAAQKYHADVVECSLNIIRENNIKPIEDHGRIEVGDSVFAIRKLLEFPYRNVAYNKLYKKEIFEGLRYPNKLYEDGYLAYKIFHKLNKYVFIGIGRYNYVKREDSIMSQQQNYTIKNLDGLEVQEERYGYLKREIKEESILSLAEFHYFHQIMHHYKMLSHNNTIDPHNKHRKMVKNKISENYLRFLNHPDLSEYKAIIRASKSNLFMFDCINYYFQLYKKFRYSLYKTKVNLKNAIGRI